MARKTGINGGACSYSGNPEGFLSPLFSYNSTVSSGTSNTDIIIASAPYRFRIIRAWFVATEASAADSEDAKLTDGTNNITDTADYSALSSGDSMEWSNYNQTYAVIDKGEALKLVKTATTAVTSLRVYVQVAREDA